MVLVLSIDKHFKTMLQNDIKGTGVIKTSSIKKLLVVLSYFAVIKELNRS